MEVLAQTNLASKHKSRMFQVKTTMEACTLEIVVLTKFSRSLTRDLDSMIRLLKGKKQK
jgi:hypothetical protein